jgi:5-methyltetrahydropteroyltriglutamate--homocysteine methyltransferase
VTLPRLARSRIGQVGVEFAASRIDPALLAGAGDKDVVVGVIDVGTEEVESPEAVADRIRRVLPHVPAHRLYLSTDCGLVPRTRAAAYGKLRALAAGAAQVRRELSEAPR